MREVNATMKYQIEKAVADIGVKVVFGSVEGVDNTGRDPEWEAERKGFPSRKMVEDAIQQHDQFIGEEDGRIMAAYIMDHECDQIYDTVQWQIKADRNEIMILHALRVLPEYG